MRPRTSLSSSVSAGAAHGPPRALPQGSDPPPHDSPVPDPNPSLRGCCTPILAEPRSPASSSPQHCAHSADAPWCSHCQAMAAAWEELGKRYKDHEDIVIAELDATANELENITISGFPTLHYFPAGPGRKVGGGTRGHPGSASTRGTGPPLISLPSRGSRWLSTKATEMWRPSPSSWKTGGRCPR